jgi:hypothetical protein
MGVQVQGPAAIRSTTVRSLRQVIAPKRLCRHMQDEGRPFELALLTPLLVIALVTVVDIFTPHLQFYRLLGAAPALAAAMFCVVGTLGIGLLALTVGVALSAVHHDLGQTPSGFTLLAITAITLAATYASRVRQHREHTLAEVRAVAETRIGGDFYEAMQTPHGVRLIIGDVRGKGLPAVEVAAAMLSTFRVHVHGAPDLPSLAGQLETVMGQYCRTVPDDSLERFVTAVLVEIPADDPIARLVNCGHPAPLLLHGDEVREVEPSTPSPPINMADLLGHHYYVDTIPFTSGDSLLLYTDGVSETRDGSGTFYPLTQRVRRWISASPRQLLDQLHQDLRDYVHGTRDDDLAALVAHRVSPCDREAAELDRAVPVQRGH